MSLNIDSLSIPISQRDNNALNSSNISIKELYEELERKDLVIKNLQSQLNSTRSNTNVILNNKIANYNKEENTLRKQIIEKDKLLLEKEKEINLLKEEIKNNKIMKVNYNEKISDFQKEILELKSQIKNYDSIVSLKDNENKKNLVEYELKIKALEKEKNIIESKTNQLVDLVKQYSKELSNTSIKFDSIESEKQTLNNLNMKLNQKNETNEKVIKDLSDKINSMKNLFNQNENLTNSLNQIQKDLNMNLKENQSLKNDLFQKEDLIKNLTNQLTEFTYYKNNFEESEKEINKLRIELKEIYSKNNINIHRANENEIELNNLINLLNKKISQIIEWIRNYFDNNFNKEINDIPQLNEINYNINLNLIIDELSKKRKLLKENILNLENQIKENENKNNELLTKIDLLYQDNVELNKKVNKEKEENIKNKKDKENYNIEIEKLKKNIFDVNKENENMKNINNEILDSHNKIIQESINLIINDSDLINLVKNIKNIFQSDSSFENNINKINEILELLKSEYLKLKNFKEQNKELCDLIDKVNKEKIELINNLEDINKENNMIKNQMEFINKDKDLILQTNQSLLNEKNSLLNLINTLNLNIDNFKKENNDLNDNLFNLQKENELIKKENENQLSQLKINYEKEKKEKINSIINDYNNKVINSEEKYKFQNQLLEKKIINLQTQMDLKDIQLKSQEEIINRRNKMLNDSLSSNLRNDDSYIKDLEKDKEKLISDNITLINDNQLLKQQIDSLTYENQQKDILIQTLSNK